MTLAKRADKIAFYGVPDSGGATTFKRMKGFSSLTYSKNPKEYSRQYVDEEFEQTDLVGYSPTLEYSFDQYVGDPVATDIVRLTNTEVTGTECVRTIVQVDCTQTSGSGFLAYSRDFAIIPNQEGGSMDAYTYSGTMKSKSSSRQGVAIISSDGSSCTFNEA